MNLTPDQQAAVTRCEEILETASHAVSGADWGAHDRARDAILDATQAVFLRLNARTGQLENGVVWPDGRLRVPLGCFRLAVEPIVAALEQQTFAIRSSDTLAGYPDIPWPERAAWDHWEFERLPSYRAALDADAAVDPAGERPSQMIWDRVALPLFQGRFPADFASKGISNPSVDSVPDVIYTNTVRFQMQLVTETEREAWLDALAAAGEQAIRILTFPFFAAGAIVSRAAGALIDGINTGAPGLGPGLRRAGFSLAIIAASTAVVVVATRKKTSS